MNSKIVALHSKQWIVFSIIILLFLSTISCYHARWFQSESQFIDTAYWEVRVFAYPTQDFEQNGTWRILFKVFQKDPVQFAYAYDIDSVEIRLDRNDKVFNLAVDSLWRKDFADTTELFLDLWSEPFLYKLNESTKIQSFTKVKTFEKTSWSEIDNYDISIEGTLKITKKNSVLWGR